MSRFFKLVGILVVVLLSVQALGYFFGFSIDLWGSLLASLALTAIVSVVFYLSSRRT